MKISIVVPSFSYGYPDGVERLLESIRNAENEHFRIEHLEDVTVVHDFTSTDSMPFKVISGPLAPKNIFRSVWSGYSNTVNEGIRKCAGEIVVILNSDNIATKPFLKHVIESFEKDEKLGVMGAKLLYPDGCIQHAGGWLKWTEGNHYGQGQPDSEVYDHPFYCPWVTGSFFVVRKSLWEKLGEFEKRFFFGCEDSKFCLDTWEAGFKVLYDPKLEAIHTEHGSTNKMIPEHREKIQIELAKSQRIFEDENWKRPLNQTYDRIWRANNELAGGKIKILILERSGAKGDVVNLTAILESLKEQNPEWSIFVRTQSPDVFRDNPHVFLADPMVNNPGAKVITLNMAHENRPWDTIPSADAEEIRGSWNGALKSEVRSIQIFSNEDDWRGMLARYRQILTQPYAVLHPSNTHWKNRNLPKLFWMEVAAELRKLGLIVVLVGQKSDALPANPHNFDLRDATTIHELHQVIAHAKVFVGADSMPFHVAQATDTPAVGVFTSVAPWLRIIGKNAVGIGPREGTCRYCYSEQPIPVRELDCPKLKNYECTKNVSVQDVMEAIKCRI